MNFKTYLAFAFLSILLISCDKGTTNPDPISYYPIALNNEWEYSTIIGTEYYDTLGNIKNIVTDTVGNTLVRIESVSDTLTDFNKLIRFVAYQSGTFSGKSTTWYENKNDGLYAIAYKNAGATQMVIPKVISGKRYLSLDNLKQVGLFLDFNLRLNKAADDTVLYWHPARKALAYPLKVGSTWNELENPFYRDRIVESKENININWNNYSVYKIGSTWRDFNNVVFNDYVSTKYGLIYREFIADSTIGISQGGNEIGFVKFTSYSKLIRKNF